MTNYNKEELKQTVFSALTDGESDKNIREFVAEFTGLKKTARNDLFNRLKNDWTFENATNAGAAPVEKGGVIGEASADVKKAITLAIGNRYTYNGDSDQYVVWLKAANKNVVIPGSLHRDMLKAYSNWTGDAATINEICRNFSIPRKWFEEYKTIMGWSHDHEPISNEELLSKDETSVVDDLLQQKRFSLHQKFQKKDWEQTQKEAELWRQLKVGQIDPFESFVKGIDLHTYGVLPVSRFGKQASGNTLVVGLSDIHCGGLSEGKYVFNGKDWNIEEYKKSMASYVEQLGTKIGNLVVKPSKIVIVGLGDLLHGVMGETIKGTPLTCDRVKDTQFDVAFDSIVTFISAMGNLAEDVELHTVSGNHDGLFNRLLMKTIAAYFRNEQRVKIVVSTTETHAFKVNTTLILINHGAAESVKAKVPAKGKARESFIQSYLLSKPELLIGTKHKIFIMGDLHSFEHTEANDFEYYRFSTFVKSDQYADALNLHSRARQNCLMIDQNGVSECWHIYFD